MKLLVPTATASPQALEEAGRQPGPCPLPSLGLALGGPSMGLSELHSFLSPWTERVGTGLRFSLETPTVLPANVCQLTKPRALVNGQTHPCPKRTFRPSPPLPAPPPAAGPLPAEHELGPRRDLTTAEQGASLGGSGRSSLCPMQWSSGAI